MLGVVLGVTSGAGSVRHESTQLSSVDRASLAQEPKVAARGVE